MWASDCGKLLPVPDDTSVMFLAASADLDLTELDHQLLLRTEELFLYNEQTGRHEYTTHVC